MSHMKECRIPFFGPLKGACPSLCPQKGKTTFFYAYVKIYVYARPKITTIEPHGGGGLNGN